LAFYRKRSEITTLKLPRNHKEARHKGKFLLIYYTV